MFDKDIIKVKNLPKDIIYDGTYYIEQSSVNSYTHNYFKYPCKFIPEVPRWAINKYTIDKDTKIIDPFAGSGTTLLEAMVMGFDSYGTEIDDIARLIIKAKTTRFSKCDLKQVRVEYKRIITNVNSDINYIIPAIDNINHWFSEENTVTLAKLLYLIREILNDSIRDFFLVVFVSIIKNCSNADNSSPKPYVSRKIIKIPVEPLLEFSKVYEKYYKSTEELSTVKKTGTVELLEGDALSFKSQHNFDLAITSPPYINAFDYGRTMRLENLWLGTLTEDSLRKKKAFYVGTEKLNSNIESNDMSILKESKHLNEVYHLITEMDKKRGLIVKRFFSDMKKNIVQVNKKLNLSGKYVIVIGNSTIRNIEVNSAKIIEDIALANGFKLLTKFKYIIKNSYINIPRNGKGGKIQFDNVIVLEKGSNNGATKS
ncbi:MAG: DNA methyltransferase [Bacilli bacterium]|nr:DNA methyltransferase [Bacilli bacterium]